MNASATSAQISGMFRWCGPKPLKVTSRHDNRGRETGRGYVATFASRAEALEAGRLVLGAFASDPEAGEPNLAVFVKTDGTAMLCVDVIA